ncbi:MAG TPA: VCBS repeat-containing protein, partial [Chryseosolibacter sp.]
MTTRKTVIPLIALIVLMSCDRDKQPEALARRTCSACHLFPEPSLLDKKTWQQGVLPEMALRMGLDISKLPGTSAAELNEILKALPSNPMIPEQEWEAIQEYYLRAAPDSLDPAPDPHPVLLTQFTASTVALPVTKNNLLTMVKRGPSGNVLIGTRNGKLYGVTESLAVLDSFQLQSAPSDVVFSPGQPPLVACMGIMDPNDLPAGSIIRPGANPETLIDSIKRPVDVEAADMNNDGQGDLVVAAFGNFTGGLYVYEGRGGRYLPHAVHSFPGTRKTIVTDFNGDGLSDILALIAQGDEQIALFMNRGNFRFSYQILLKFPPVYGSSYFELADFNGDGKADILYTNGDNADYSPILKPYHGVRIFLNNGKNYFREWFFYPMYGASMARALDFDEDGDLDIAAISFFPDFKRHPEYGF